VNLSHLLREAEELPTDASPEYVQETLAKLRAALADGLEGHRDQLRAFLTLADKFGSHSDAWNAAMLLEASGELDSHAKAIRVSAWLRLFPDSARTRPKTVLDLLGPDGRAGLTSAALSGVLTRWLDATMASAERLGRQEALSQTLLAAAELGACWWPEQDWPSEAPGFASAFVDAAHQVARSLLSGRLRETARLSRALALAMMVREALDDEADRAEDPGAIASRASAQDAPGGRDAIDALVRSLNASRRRIWVVGALRTKWEHLMGVAKTFGIDPSVFQHIGYDELKGRSLLDRVDLVKDFGVLLGPVPHSVSGLGGHASLVSQLRHEAGIGVVELRTQFESQDLRISKSSFRSALERLLADAAVTGTTP